MEYPQGVNAPVPGNGHHAKEFVLAIIVLAIALAAGYMIYKKNSERPAGPAANDPVVQSLSSQSSSDDVGSIEADLQATDVSSIDK